MTGEEKLLQDMKDLLTELVSSTKDRKTPEAREIEARLNPKTEDAYRKEVERQQSLSADKAQREKSAAVKSNPELDPGRTRDVPKSRSEAWTNLGDSVGATGLPGAGLIEEFTKSFKAGQGIGEAINDILGYGQNVEPNKPKRSESPDKADDQTVPAGFGLYGDSYEKQSRVDPWTPTAEAAYEKDFYQGKTELALDSDFPTPPNRHDVDDTFGTPPTKEETALVEAQQISKHEIDGLSDLITSIDLLRDSMDALSGKIDGTGQSSPASGGGHTTSNSGAPTVVMPRRKNRPNAPSIAED